MDYHPAVVRRAPERGKLARVLDELEALYGPAEPPPTTEPLGLILWESVAYLAADDARRAAFDALVERVGTDPEKILAADPALLARVAALGGIFAEKRAGRLREIAEIALRDFAGGLELLLRLPVREAKHALMRFPAIGDPGAEKVLLFTGARPIFALDSNGLRVLVRLGHGEEKKDYAATYRAVREAVRSSIVEECGWLIRAHQLLRRHGQETCRRSRPRCELCPVARLCAYYKMARKRR